MKRTFQLKLKAKCMFKACLFCAVFTGLLVIFSFFKGLLPGKFERLTHGTIGVVVSLITTWLFLRFDRKSFRDIGLRFENTTLNKFFIGVLTGVGLMGVMAICVIYFSDFRIIINKNSSFLNFLFWTMPLLPLAFMEEVGFRAYPLVIVKDKAGIRSAIIVTSILFALYHIANGWSVAGSFLGPGVWGIVYGLSAIYSNGISMPTGMHYAANLTTSAFGITDRSFNIWIVKQSDGLTLENYQQSQMATIIPQVSLLIFGIICMELFLRKDKSAKIEVAG